MPSTWLTYRNDERGIELPYPPDWFVAPGSLTPRLGLPFQPWEIVSLGTYPNLVPADHNCAHVPVNALEELGPTDAFISVQERRPPLYESTTPPRPHRFTPDTGLNGAKTEVVSCLSVRPSASFRWIPFESKGREFYIIVAIGSAVSEQRRADAFRVLDAMVITPPTLPCDAAIGTRDSLSEYESAIGHRVALPTERALQANRSTEDDPKRDSSPNTASTCDRD